MGHNRENTDCEGISLRHIGGDEGHAAVPQGQQEGGIARKAVELGHHESGARRLAPAEGGLQLGPVIALAAFYFGRTSAFRTALGALLFGVFDAAQIRLQGRGVPAEIVQTLPYVIDILVLTGLGFADRRSKRGGALS